MIAVPLHDASQWPLRMTREEVAHVSRRSLRWLHSRIAIGAFPRPDGDGMWARDVVRRYQEGGIQQFDAALAKRQKQASRFFGSHRRRA